VRQFFRAHGTPFRYRPPISESCIPSDPLMGEDSECPPLARVIVISDRKEALYQENMGLS
jgi:hypothetical protein